MTDVNSREQLILFPTLALALLLGIMPSLVFSNLNASVLNLVSFIQQFI
ncbi:hypothetical protein KUH03_24030 [Sphingobacterium sp. E70]|nr:hypothetical protein [Sphingobacterium sp. E70]ULT22468.1 hypothetical protein KUH03_24030 [Sphingobacterium sp. E70]